MNQDTSLQCSFLLHQKLIFWVKGHATYVEVIGVADEKKKDDPSWSLVIGVIVSCATGVSSQEAEMMEL
jgi:hypothetical protein